MTCTHRSWETSQDCHVLHIFFHVHVGVLSGIKNCGNWLNHLQIPSFLWIIVSCIWAKCLEVCRSNCLCQALLTICVTNYRCNRLELKKIIPIFGDKFMIKIITHHWSSFIHKRMPNLIWQPVVGMARCQVARHGSRNKDPRTTFNPLLTTALACSCAWHAGGHSWKVWVLMFFWKNEEMCF